ncbi:Uncharacterized protein dnl_21530 [Desulfonema limicola]|uniref:Uncharacterized protein n=1 Tax=Desulfonema limicola TaxID=45656 RepID=A0A975GG13_9BACT|nr:hypothetical protein [Desulfonema limicola]QTA79871.1 Uncharacterized protein dnl_21530 [Desulfonema limicola]
MAKQKNNLMYTFFYTIFSIWPWRIVFGIGIGTLLGLSIGTRGMNTGGAVMLWIMLMFTGWWLAYFPAKLTTDFLKKALTK